ncbi:hypothetical protein CERSUDRAFT_122674, partial [Gelatoporia subvermispora B]
MRKHLFAYDRRRVRPDFYVPSSIGLRFHCVMTADLIEMFIRLYTKAAVRDKLSF